MSKCTIQDFFGIRGHEYLVCPYDRSGPTSLLQMVHHMAIKIDLDHRRWRKQHGLPEYIDHTIYKKWKDKVMSAIFEDRQRFDVKHRLY
jgi:hypothetical protein